MEKLVFATNNENKFREIKNMLTGKYELLKLNDIGCVEDIPEEKDTIKENASDKAKYVKQKYGYDCFADDTGLEVEALNMAPGVFSARYAGPQKNSDDNIEKLLSELKHKKNRKARFKTVIALISNNKEYHFEGIVNGKIIDKKTGTDGFGYDPVFIPEGYNETFAQMSLDEKNKISHRAKAVEKLIEFLNNK